MDSDQGMVKRPMAILKRENQRDWFDNMRDYLTLNDAFWVIEDDEQTPASSQWGEEEIPSLARSYHNPAWKKMNAKAKYYIRICICEDDRELMTFEATAKGMWNRLKDKYTMAYAADAMALVVQYVTYRMEEQDTIQYAWSHLASIGRRIAEVDPSQGNYKDPETRIKHLLRALPPQYQSTRQAINTQSLDHFKILKLLESQEAEFKQEGQDTAMYAGRQKESQYACFLCEGNHGIKDCPHLDGAKRAIKTKQSGRRSPTSSVHKRGTSPDKDQLKKMVKMLAKEVQELKVQAKKGRTFEKGFAAREDSPASSSKSQEDTPSQGDDVDEVAHSTVEAKGKYPSSEWMLDSCASSHMTDQPCLFRHLSQLRVRTWIKVGGGYLKATHVGKAVMGGRKGKQIVLEGVLLVPGLGVNLVSWNQLSKQFGVQPPKFTLNSLSGEPVIKTRMHGGVPFIEEIDQALVEKA
ncbi:uncharacterized protein, partial [Primulina huaijiensis]|uniref:uncharacterized protein n=1 Tax=Primulina huaijiensis TaxID=1492673 RepID=UPI003CC70C37